MLGTFRRRRGIVQLGGGVTVPERASVPPMSSSPPATDEPAADWHRRVAASAVGTGLVSGLWVVLVAIRPGTTFHFAPLLAAAAGPAAARLAAGGKLTRRRAAAVAIASVLTVLGVAVVLDLTGHLGGPTLWSRVDAPAEAVAFAALGGLWGFRIASRSRKGLLFAHERPPDESIGHDDE